MTPATFTDTGTVNPLARSQDAYDRFSAAIEVPMTVLAVVWLPVLIVPAVARIPASAADALDAIDYLVWAAFAAEYLAKLYLAPSRAEFFRAHLVDLAVVAVPVLRPLRVLRLLRLVTFSRVGLTLSTALNRARNLLTHHGLHYVLLSVLAIIAVGAALELAFEQHAPGSNIHDYGDALWWAIVTVTTVGYGDKYPVSVGGRGVAVVLMLTGIGLVGVLSATVASYFVGQRAEADMAELHRRLDRIEAMLTRTLPGEHGLPAQHPLPAQHAQPAQPIQHVLPIQDAQPGQDEAG
jgi:voltage-gated potassium channel